MIAPKSSRGVSTLHVYSLASGSSGNSMLVRGGGTNILIDAGISVRKVATALTKIGLTTGDLDAILLTHEHSDHMIGAPAVSRRYNAPIVANLATFEEVRRRNSLACEFRAMATGESITIGDMEVVSFSVCHDAAEPVGYTVRFGPDQVTYFTDAGCVTEEMRTALSGATLAIAEANYDHDWLMRGPYPAYRKERVASSLGHLSNVDCGDLLADRVEKGGPLHIWLAHLSRINNSPALARKTVQERIAARTSVPFSLEVALRDQPSLVWSSRQK